MRIENLEQLDVARQQRNQIALVAALELGRSERAHFAEDLVTHERENLECEIVVAQLLAVAKRTAYHAAHRHRHARRAHRNRGPYACGIEQAIRREHRKENRRKETEHAQKNRERHNGQKRTRKAHKPRHDAEVRTTTRL